MRFVLPIATFALIALPAQVFAQCAPQTGLMDMPEGHALMTISATESQEVEQDLLIATLTYVVEDQDSNDVQNDINAVMTKALETSKKANNVKVNTGTYQVYETRDARSKEKMWHGSQALTLKSKSAEDLLALAGKLQDMKLTMNGLSYALDPETAAIMQDNMMEAALIKLQSRADRAAKALGKSTAELLDVSAQSSGGDPMPMPSLMRGVSMEMAAADMAMPVASAGEQILTLTVSARAVLKP